MQSQQLGNQVTQVLREYPRGVTVNSPKRGFDIPATTVRSLSPCRRGEAGHY
jgi:hypothetical protein